MASRGSRFALPSLLCLTAALGCSSAPTIGAEGGAGGNQTTGGAPGAGGTTSGGSGGTPGGGTSGSGGTTSTGGAPGSGGTPGGGGTPGSGGTPGPTSARAFTDMLGRKPNFLIGMGNDYDPNYDHSKDGAFTLGVTMDLHYGYLVGLMGKGGWTDWNSGGTFVDILADAADKKGTTPMYTLYSMAASGEGNAGALTDADYMKRYWDGAKLLFQRLGSYGKPAVVHLEPDFWAFVQQKSNGDATKLKTLVKMAADCADLPDDLTGMGGCLVRLARKYAPKTAVGFHVSGWGGSPEATVSFMAAVGAKSGDFVATDALDRDAGCFEVKTDPNCQRGGSFYWDETNMTSPNFHEHLAWVKTITTGLGKPMLWWQVPFGVPSNMPGGTVNHYRDNRVHYLFGHIQEFIDAGFVGSTFGTGAGNQTYITTDGGQFKNAVTNYFGHPVPLP
jgi:hypothetical protein